jgi:hypothetical protein
VTDRNDIWVGAGANTELRPLERVGLIRTDIRISTSRNVVMLLTVAARSKA